MVYLEVYLLTNFCADAFLLFLCAQWSGRRVKKSRIVLGAGTGTLGALISSCMGGWGYAGQTLLALCMLRISMGPARGRDFLGACAAFFLCALVALGAMSMKIPAAVSAAAACFGVFALSRRLKYPPGQRLRVVLVENGEKLYLEALMDTGNLARDLYTGLPVLVLPSRTKSFLGKSHGSIFIRTAAGTRLLPRFRPEKILVEGKEVEAVAVLSPEEGMNFALLPASLAQGLQERTVA